MEDADSDSGFDSDGDWYHAGRDIVHGLRTNSHAVGPTEHTEDGSCAEKRKREAPGGDASLLLKQCIISSKKSTSIVHGVTVPLWNMEVERVSTEQVIRRTYS